MTLINMTNHFIETKLNDWLTLSLTDLPAAHTARALTAHDRSLQLGRGSRDNSQKLASESQKSRPLAVVSQCTVVCFGGCSLWGEDVSVASVACSC